MHSMGLGLLVVGYLLYYLHNIFILINCIVAKETANSIQIANYNKSYMIKMLVLHNIFSCRYNIIYINIQNKHISK